MTGRPIDIFRPIEQAINRISSGSSDHDLNPSVVLPVNRVLRPAAVLVPILRDGQACRLILTKRSSALKHHPGQIAFPGGKKDPEDPDLKSTALREASEEIGLRPDMVRIIGRMPSHETVTGFDVTPFVAVIEAEFNPIPEPGEVEEVFEVPMAHVLDPGNYLIQSRRWRGHRRRYYTVPYGPYYIWGATARMLRSLAEAIKADDTQQ